MGYTESASNNTENYGRTIEHSLLVQFNIDVFDSHGFRVRIINVLEIYFTALFNFLIDIGIHYHDKYIFLEIKGT